MREPWKKKKGWVGFVSFCLFPQYGWVEQLGLFRCVSLSIIWRKKGRFGVGGCRWWCFEKREREKEGTMQPLVNCCGLWVMKTTTRRGEGLLWEIGRPFWAFYYTLFLFLCVWVWFNQIKNEFNLIWFNCTNYACELGC